MNHKANEGTVPVAKRHRSPSYPCVSLPMALSLLRRITELVGFEAFTEKNLAQAMGYEGGSSWLSLQVSALRKFGLLEIIPAGPTRERSCMPTPLAHFLLTSRAGSAERQAALRQAALRPPIYDDLWSRFGSDLPPNPAMAGYLVDARSFNPKAVEALLADFRATVDFADLKAMPRQERYEGVAPLDAYSRIHAMDRGRAMGLPPVGQTHFIGAPSTIGGNALDNTRKMLEQMHEQSDHRMASIPLAEGETATINMPKKMSPQSWQMLLDTLELWKKQAGAADVF